MIHFLPVSDLHIFSNNCQTLWKIKKITFSRKIMTFFSRRPQISIFPLIFPVSVHFPPVSRKLFFSPTLTNFPSVFEKFTCFLHTLCVFRFPPTFTMMHLCITQCAYWTPL